MDQGVLQGALQFGVDTAWQLDRSGLFQQANGPGMGHFVNILAAGPQPIINRLALE